MFANSTVLFLQHALLMKDPAMIQANVVGFGISVAYSVFFYLYTPRQSKAGFWKQLGMAGAVTAAILAYAQIENPELVEDRFGLIITVMMLMLIAQPLFGLVSYYFEWLNTCDLQWSCFSRKLFARKAPKDCRLQ